MMRHALAVALAATLLLGVAAGAPAAERRGAVPFEIGGTPQQGGIVFVGAPAGAVAVTLDGQPVAVAADGAFAIGFDRDAPAAETLRATFADGHSVEQRVAVAPRAWRIERLPTLPRHAEPEPVFEALRAPELAAIAAARTRVTGAEGWRQRFRWPAAGRQSGWFGAQRIYSGEPGAFHTGADVAVPDGTAVLAPADGVVILAADHPFTLEGNLLMIDHGAGLSSALLHLSRIDVHAGDRVRQGQVVGLSGHTGRATGPHLHWGLRWHDARLDPLLVVGTPPPAA